MKSQSSKSELNKYYPVLQNEIINGKQRTYIVDRELSPEAKQQLLDLALSCLPEKRIEPKSGDLTRQGWEVVDQARGFNAAIDTIEAEIKLKFGGK